MTDFLQTLAISTIPAACTGLISYLVSAKQAKTQIEAIKAQNKADIDKLVEQHKVDLEAEQEKHRHEMELKEQEHSFQLEKMRMQLDNEMKKEENTMINQLTAQTLGGLMSGIFGQDSPMSDFINQAVEEDMKEAKVKQK